MTTAMGRLHHGSRGRKLVRSITPARFFAGTTNRAGAQALADHIATADDPMVHRRVDSWVARRDPACAERDKALAVRIDPTRFPSAVSRGACILQRAVDVGPFWGLHLSSLGVSARMMDVLRNRISYNANLAAAH